MATSTLCNVVAMENDLQAIKEEIRARVDIVEVIGNYTRLKRTGKNWTGLCPFHADKKPSFSVVPHLGIYKCFSCGEAGDLFKFVQKKENLEFIEALEWLARRAGIPFERRGVDPQKASEREQMLALNQMARDFFLDRLAKSPEAQEYLYTKRAIFKSTQEQFDIGYAPPEWEGLTYFLQRKKANLELAAKIGLVKSRQQEGNGHYDAFRNRLIFPIHDVSGRIIAFGGRDMSGQEDAKYINSPESPLFDKSNTLYGLYFGKKKLSGDTPAVFVEGYVDVVMAHQAGFSQCIATLGTSMTEGHARMLARYNPKAIICYDADRAGINATLKGAAIWEAQAVEGAEVRVARLPAGDDPDSLLKRGETAAFQAALDNAIPRVDFQMELALQRHDIKTEEGKSAALAEIIPILASVRMLTQRDRYAQKFAFLHPSHGTSIGRAVEQILADAETYARLSKNGQAPRNQGYPLTEQANRGPLAGEPLPPTYKPPTEQNWGEANWPHTENVAPGNQSGNAAPNADYRPHGAYPSNQNINGNGYPGNGYRSNNGNGSSGYVRDDNGKWRKRKPQGPPTDPTPPSLAAPELTGAEKAERQLLRALFMPEWRVSILNDRRVRPELFLSEPGRRLFALIARTPAQADGSIDPLPLLYHAEDEENAERNTENGPVRDPQGRSAPDAPPVLDNKASTSPLSSKLSTFIRDLLEDSVFLVSNERLNETVVADCIRRLEREAQDRQKRELVAILQHADTLPPEQQRQFIAEYHQKMRAMRGSPPVASNET